MNKGDADGWAGADDSIGFGDARARSLLPEGRPDACRAPFIEERNIRLRTATRSTSAKHFRRRLWADFIDAEASMSGLRSVARALNKGDISLAMIGSLLMKLPEIDEGGAARSQALFKANFDPAQFRDDAGSAESFYHGFPDADGYYRDDQGRIIARQVGTGLMLNVDAALAPDDKSDAPDVDALEAKIPFASSGLDDDEPKVCPDPTDENINGRSARTVAYQTQITGLPPGLDMEYHGVRFDGCDESTGRMLEVKGLGGREWQLKFSYDDILEKEFYTTMMKQAKAQSIAAGGRGVDWHFADPIWRYFSI